MNDIDIKKISVSRKFPFREQGFIYLIDYKDNK